jgi:uncharacterized protein (UPF0335 family)
MAETTHAVAKDQLKSVIERIEKLEAEKKEVTTDITEVYAEAKANGYDVRALKTIIKLRKMDADERAEQEAILDTYLSALGMLVGTPLGDSAVARATTTARTRSPQASDIAKVLDAG